MDSIYIVSKNTSYSNQELLNMVLNTVFVNRYLLSTASYYNDSLLPGFKIENEEEHFDSQGIKVFPLIWLDFFDEDTMYHNDDNFPVSYNGYDCYPVISFRCRESIFLLEFLAKIISSNTDLFVCNVHNKIQDINDLQSFLKVRNYGWAYIE